MIHTCDNFEAVLSILLELQKLLVSCFTNIEIDTHKHLETYPYSHYLCMKTNSKHFKSNLNKEPDKYCIIQ